MFSDDTRLERIGPGRSRAEVSKRWWVARGPHGGYVAALLLRAMSAAVPDPARPPRSFTAHFAAAHNEGPLEIVTTVERDGRSLSTVSARAEQDGRVMALALCAFSTEWQAPAFDDAPPPEVASAEDAFPVPPEGEGIPPFLANFDMRWAIGEAFFSGADRAEVGGWIRTREPETADAPAIAALMDAWPPVVFPRVTERIVCPTVDLTIHFRTPFPLEGAKPEDFYLTRFTSKLLREGFFEEDGEMWGPDGRLIAQSRQLALAMRSKGGGN